MAYLWLFIIFIVGVNGSYNGPEVKTPLGIVRGIWKVSYAGKDYSSFEGIPYATPPVGDLRFEEALPVQPWKGEWEAIKPKMCLQFGMMNYQAGTEDCLYLNVYVPGKTINPESNYDVHVHIHGGAFMSGSGHQLANSDYLMNHESIVLVSINYRLGVLGFLSTEDEEIPGNNGMKDQVLALKWVKNNIKSFGGNSDSITITGLSAGGASVHLHYLSPLSRGLFHRGISNSGVALNPWVIKENPLIFARNLSAELGCSTSSTRAMKDCLKSKPSDIILRKSKAFYEYGKTPFSPFAVVIEKNSKNPFLSENPYHIMKSGNVADVPWIASSVKDEGIYPSLYFCSELNKVNNEFEAYAHLMLDYNHTLPVTKRKTFATGLREHYFGNDTDIKEETIQKFFDMFTHRLFAEGIETAVKLQSEVNRSPVYYYYFDFGKGSFSLSKFLCPQKNIKGIAHGDDSVYLYGSLTISNPSESEKKMYSSFTMMINSFVKGKEPKFTENLKWLPSKGQELTYLHITDDDFKIEKTKSMVPENLWNEINKVEFESLS